MTVALFFLSGISGLIYQVVWVRQFGNWFGNTLHSASLVTAVFLCGLGVGSVLGGRWADRRFPVDRAGPLRAYGICEIAIAVLGLLLAGLLPRLAVLSATVSWYEPDAVGWYALSWQAHAARYAVAVVLLAPSSLLMGATLTLLIRLLVGVRVGIAGWRIGLLYGANTAGAALGALLTDFSLVPAVGIFGTQSTAAGINLAAGFGALVLARNWIVSGGGQGTNAVAEPRAPQLPARPPRAAARRRAASQRAMLMLGAAALLLAGTAALGIEMLWFRYLSQVMRQLRVVFSLLLAVILVGIWLGSFAAGFLHRRFGRPIQLFILGQGALAITTLLLLGWFDHGALFHDHIGRIWDDFLRASATERSIMALWSNLNPVVLVAAVPSFFMGFAFPLVNAHVQQSSAAVGGRAGTLYLANTVGNVLGATLTGFALLPWLGLQRTAFLLAGLSVLAMVPLYFSGRQQARTGARRPSRALLGATAAVSAFVLWRFHQLPPRQLLLPCIPRGVLNQRVRELVTIAEGRNETVVVTEIVGFERRLHTNGHRMSSTSPMAQRYMRASAHLPLLQHPSPERVLVICFGVGNTVHAASLHPTVQRIDVADLSRQVLEHASYFEDSNQGVLRDSRVRVFVNDGRHHLLTQPPDSYDLINLEPPPIYYAGVVSLYTREFYELARSRLRPGGFITQWLPAYQAPEGVVRSMVRAFIDVFPEAVLLSSDFKELVLMGTTGPSIRMDHQAVAQRLRRLPPVRADLRRIHLGTMPELVGTFLASPASLARASAAAQPLVDDQPSLEYCAELATISYRTFRLPDDLIATDELDAWCRGCRRTIPGLDAYLRVLEHVYGTDAFRTSRGIPPTLIPGLDELRAVERHGYLQDLFFGKAHVAQRVAGAHLRAGRTREAIATARFGVAVAPTDPESHELLGQALAAAQARDEAVTALQRAVELDPRRASARFTLARVLAASGHTRHAIAEAERGLDLEPHNVTARCDVAKWLIELRRYDRARAHLERALTTDPRHARAAALLESVKASGDRAAVVPASP